MWTEKSPSGSAVRMNVSIAMELGIQSCLFCGIQHQIIILKKFFTGFEIKANMFLIISSFKVSYEPKRVQEVFELVAAAQLISRFYIWGPNDQYVFVKVDSKDAYEIMKSKQSFLRKNRAFPFINCPGRNWLRIGLC